MIPISFKLKDFKCHRDTAIKLNHLTLLTGANAAGKSSLIQALLLLNSALENMKSSVGFVDVPLSDTTRNLDLGTVDNIINKDSKDDNVVIDVQGEKFVVYGKDVTDLHFIRIHLPESNLNLIKNFQNITYLSAERQGPRFEYDLELQYKKKTGCNGQYAASVIYNNEFTQVGQKKTLEESVSLGFRAQLNAWLQYFFPGVSLMVKSNGMTKIQVYVNNENTHNVNFSPNVGFGISYALPIVVDLLLAEEDDFVIIENPEAHLHAKAQSNMGYFIGRMASAGVRILLETHSEHIVNGIRRAIVDQKALLRPESVSIYFFSMLSNILNIDEISIDKYGNLSNFPVDFFDQQRQDSLEIFRMQKK